jgi:hypothetical protein
MSYDSQISTRFRPKGYEFVGFFTNGDNKYWKYELKSNLFNTIKPIKDAKIIYYLPKKNKYYNEEFENLDINNKLYDGLEQKYENEKYSTLIGGKLKLTKKFKDGKRKSTRKRYTKKCKSKKNSTKKRHY